MTTENKPTAPMERLLAFCAWERKHMPAPDGSHHIAEWAADEIKFLALELQTERAAAVAHAQSDAPCDRVMAPDAHELGDTGHMHEDLRRWGAALDKVIPNGICERLLRYGDDWRAEVARLDRLLVEQKKALREPLSDAEIGAVASTVWEDFEDDIDRRIEFARAVEAAQGIKGDSNG